jgi:hypothetical protein
VLSLPVVEAIRVGAAVMSESKAVVVFEAMVDVGHSGTVKVGMARAPDAHSIHVLFVYQPSTLRDGRRKKTK